MGLINFYSVTFVQHGSSAQAQASKRSGDEWFSLADQKVNGFLVACYSEGSASVRDGGLTNGKDVWCNLLVDGN
jgi:hypothetical protein